MKIEFKDLLKPYTLGETECINFLTNLGYDVEDVSDNRNYWFKDIDLICRKDGKTTTIEVKADSKINTTNNLFIETVSNEQTKREGWFFYCEADYLFYYDTIDQYLYIINYDDLKQLNMDSYKTARAYDSNKTSIGILLPLSDCPIKYKFKINTKGEIIDE